MTSRRVDGASEEEGGEMDVRGSADGSGRKARTRRAEHGRGLECCLLSLTTAPLVCRRGLSAFLWEGSGISIMA